MEAQKHLSDEQILTELKFRFDRNTNLVKEQSILLGELRTLNNRLLDAERLKGNFLSNIRNEIVNPLSSMLGMTRLLADGDLAAERAKQISALLHTECFRLDFHLKNIFQSAELEAGESRSVAISFNVIEIVENVIADFEHELEKKKIKVDLDTNNKLELYVHGDAEKIRLLLANLLSNAIQFNKENGTVTVTVSNDSDKLQIAVQDTGIGIKDNDTALIFDRFRQLDEGSTKRFGGQGLGLSVCKAIVELMEGTIHFTSIYNQGSTFTIELPLSAGGENLEAFSSDGNDFLFGDFDQIKL